MQSSTSAMDLQNLTLALKALKKGVRYSPFGIKLNNNQHLIDEDIKYFIKRIRQKIDHKISQPGYKLTLAEREAVELILECEFGRHPAG